MEHVALLDKGYIELQDVMGSDLDIVNAARVSFLGESKGNIADKKLLFYLWKNRHTTPFEMCEMKFRVKAPLLVARQWMRHRTFSYNEVSRRYTSEQLDFYEPTEWRGQSSNNKQASNGLVDTQMTILAQQLNQIAVSLYNQALDEGIAREQARILLPQSMYTSFIAKVDLKNLLHFVNLRTHEHAQYEIRVYADAIFEMIKTHFPWTAEAYLENSK